MTLPLLESYILGALACLAGLSFLLPNRMHPLIKAPIAILCTMLGALYLYMTFVPMAESEKAPIIRAILAAIVVCMLVSNIGAFIVERLRVKALKRTGIPIGRRKDDNV